jgi:preprotein translocase SecE subunit
MPGSKKVRVRKTAPTIRERVEDAKVKSEAPVKPSRIKPALNAAAWPLRPIKRVRLPQLPDNQFFKVLSRILNFFIPRYIINSWKELRQVTWPNRRETWRLTGAVIIFAIIFGGLVAALDKVLDVLFKNLVLK